MKGFEGFTDKDYEMSQVSAGTIISLFVWVLMIVLGVLIGQKRKWTHAGKDVAQVQGFVFIALTRFYYSKGDKN